MAPIHEHRDRARVVHATRSPRPRSSTSTSAFRRQLKPLAQAAAAQDRQARAAAGVARGLRGRLARPSPHLAPVRAASRRPDLAAHDSRPGARRAGHDRAPPRRRQRPHRLEPGLDHQLLDPAARRQSRARASRRAAGEVDDAEPVRRSPAVPDRRQLRRDRGGCRDAAPEPERGDRAPARAPVGVAGRRDHRPPRARRGDVDIKWSGGRATEVRLRPDVNGERVIRPPKGQRIAGIVSHGAAIKIAAAGDGLVRASLLRGEEYTVRFE